MAGATSGNTNRVEKQDTKLEDQQSWRKTVDSDFLCNVLTTEESVLVTGQRRFLEFSKRTGEVLKSTVLPGNLAGSPALLDNTVFVPRDVLGEGFAEEKADTGSVHAINIQTGEIEWSRALLGADVSSIAVGTDIYVHSESALYRITPTNQVVWRGSLPESLRWKSSLSYVRPTVGPDSIYVSLDDSIAKFDKDDGALVWTKSIPEPRHPPVLANDELLLIGSGSELRAVDTDSGNPEWTLQSENLWSPAVSESIVVAPMNGGLSGISLESGEVRWQTPMDHVAYNDIITGQTIIVRTTGTEIHLLDVSSGDHRGTVETGGLVRSLVPTPQGLYTVQERGDELAVVKVVA